MNRLLIRIVPLLAIAALGYFFIFRQSPPPPVNANLSPDALKQAMVLPMGQLIWETQSDAAFTRATQNNKPVLMLYTAQWCGPCRRIHDGALTDPKIQQAIMDRYIPLYMDLTQRTDSPTQRYANHYNVKSIPHFVIASPDGQLIAHDIAAMDSATMLQWIQQH